MTTIEDLLLTHHTSFGADKLLDPALRVAAVDGRVQLLRVTPENVIAEVMLRELPTIRAFLVVREDSLAVPRDVVAQIAREASRALSKRAKAQHKH